MKRRAAILFVSIVVGLLVLTLVLAQSEPVERFAGEQIRSILKNQLYSDVTIGSSTPGAPPPVEIRLLSFSPSIILHDVTIRPKTPGAKQEFSEPTLRVDNIRVVFRPLQLMARRVDIERVELEHPHADVDLIDGKIHGLPLPLVNDVDYSGGAASDGESPLRIDAILVRNGLVHFTADEPDVEVGLTNIKGLATIEPDGSIAMDVEAEGRRLHLRMEDADLEEPLGKLAGGLVVSADGKKVELKSVHGDVGPVTAMLSGKVSLAKGPLNLDLSSMHVDAPLSLVEQFENKTPSMQGTLDYNGSLAVKGKDVRARGRAKIDDFRLDRFHLGATDAEVDVAGNRAHSKRLEIAAAGGKIDGTADMSWINGDLKLGADVKVHNASFAQIMDAVGVDGSHVDARVDGHVAFEGPVDADFDVKGSAELTHHEFLWSDRGWEETGARHKNLAVKGGDVTGKFEITHDGMKFAEVDATAGTAKVALDGNLFFRGAADINFRATPVDLSEVSPIGSVALAGRGPASGRVHGEFEKLVIDSDLDLEGVKVGGFDFGRGKGPVTFADLVLSSPGTTFTRGKSDYAGPWKVDFNDPISLSFDVHTSGSRAEDLADIMWGDMPASAYVQGGIDDAHIRLSGPFDKLNGAFDAKGASMTVKGEKFAALAAKGRWKDGTICLDNLIATKKSGASLYARGQLLPAAEGKEDLGGVVQLEAHSARMTLGDLDNVGTDSPTQGDAALRMTINGTFYRPDFSGRLDLSNTKFHNTPLGTSQINFETVEDPDTKIRDLLVANGTVFGGSAHVISKAHLWRTKEVPYNASLTFERHSLKPYLWYLNDRLTRDDDLTALATGHVTLNGKLLDPATSTLDLKVKTLSLTRGPHEITNRDPIDLSFGDGRVDIRSLTLMGDETNFSIRGREDADGNLDFRAEGDLDLALAGLGTDVFTRIEGVLRVPEPGVVINGSAKDPIISGTADVENAVFKTRFPPQQPLENVRGHIIIKQDEKKQEIAFENVTGKFGGGTFSGGGSLALDGFSVKYWDLSTHVNESTVRFDSHALRARVTGDLFFRGPAARPLMSGDLTVAEGRYTEALDWKSKAISWKQSHDVFTAPDEASKLFELAIKLRAAENLIIKPSNGIADVELRTVENDPMEIVGNTAQWGILGGLELGDKGHAPNKAFFQGHEFIVKSARITFVSKDSLDFTYEITAETAIRDWTIHATIRGRYGTGYQSYTFDSVPPLSQDDVNLLLVAGITRQEAGEKDAAVLAGIAASVVGEGLVNQRGLARPFAGLVDSYQLVPDYSQGQAGIKVEVKKQLTPQLVFDGAVGTGGRSKAQLDYRFNKTLHVQGGWDNTEPHGNQTRTEGDIGMDAKFRFEWK